MKASNPPEGSTMQQVQRVQQAVVVAPCSGWLQQVHIYDAPLHRHRSVAEALSQDGTAVASSHKLADILDLDDLERGLLPTLRGEPIDTLPELEVTKL